MISRAFPPHPCYNSHRTKRRTAVPFNYAEAKQQLNHIEWRLAQLRGSL